MSTLSEQVTEQTVRWMVRLQSGRMSPREQQQLDAWLAAAPAHQHAWQVLQQSLGASCGRLRELEQRAPGAVSQARHLLTEEAPTRRGVLRAMVGLSVGGALTWSLQKTDAARVLMADMSTGTGERRHFQLSDGSRLTLDAASAADFSFDATQRRLELLKGQVVVEVAEPVAQGFVVRTGDGQVQAQGARLLVSRDAAATRVVALERSASVLTLGQRSLLLQAGQGTSFTQAGIGPVLRDQVHQADWLEGKLSVIDQPLDRVIAALRPYLPGLVHVGPGIGQIRVQGVFPLDRPQEALTLLAETLRVEVRHYGPWLTLVSARA